MTNDIIYVLGLNSRALRLRWVDIWLRLTPGQCWLQQWIVFWWSVLAKLVEDISWAASWLSGVSPTGLRILFPLPVLLPCYSCYHRCLLCRSDWMAREASKWSKHHLWNKMYFQLSFSPHWLLRSSDLPLSSSQGPAGETLWTGCSLGVEDSPDSDHGDGAESSAARWSGQDTARDDSSNIAESRRIDTGPGVIELMMGNCINDIRELFLFPTIAYRDQGSTLCLERSSAGLVRLTPAPAPVQRFSAKFSHAREMSKAVIQPFRSIKDLKSFIF